jgi:hypothetical protein
MDLGGASSRLMERSRLREMVSKCLDGRQLIFFGIRGDDVEGVGDQPELAAAFSIIAAHGGRTALLSGSLEQITGRRVDLDAYDIDAELHEAGVVELRRQILRVLSQPSVIFTYRPSTFLSAICFARNDLCEYAGMFAAHQSAFEHKPWVESTVRQMGIPSIPWTYVADEDQMETVRRLADGPLVFRRSRSSGGAGLVRIGSATEIQLLWPEQDEAFVSVAPYIPDGVPVNVSGVVWHDGVTLHGASVQLIGVQGLTSRPFGYCGNDFGAAKDLNPGVLVHMEEATVRIGRWLYSCGYSGAFGVDFLIDDDRALFMEVNPRLQGVSHLACQSAAIAGNSCVLLEHLAANLGIGCGDEGLPLTEQVASAPEVAHLVIHAPDPGPPEFSGEDLKFAVMEWPLVQRIDVVCPRGVWPEPGATIGRITVRDRVTDSGFELRPTWANRLTNLRAGVE